MRKSIKQASLIVLIALVLVAFCVYFLSIKKTNSTKKNFKPVKVVTVESTKVPVVLESIGTAISNEAVDITSNVTQKVVSVNFSDCEMVKKGRLLVQLNTEKKKAAQKQAEIHLLEQKREMNRMHLLKNKKIIPEKDFDFQQTKLLDAQAKLDEIIEEIKESSIVAPFDGVLGIRKVSVGALLTPGSVVTTIDDISSLKVDFCIPEKYSLLVNPKCKITAKSVAIPLKKFDGKVVAISPRVSPISRSISVRGEIENQDYLLRPGMMLKITVQLDDRSAIMVPESAIVSVGERNFVFCLDEKNRAQKKAVTLGIRKKGLVEVSKGLQAGCSIISEGLLKLSDGDEVKILKEKVDSKKMDVSQ